MLAYVASIVDSQYSADHDLELRSPHFFAGHMCKHTLQ